MIKFPVSSDSFNTSQLKSAQFEIKKLFKNSVFLGALLIGIFATLVLLKTVQDLRQRASYNQTPECTSSLQAKIDAAAAGSTVIADPCIYRETIKITKPITLDGKGISELRGSDIWTGWNQQSATYISTNVVPTFQIYTQDPNGRCLPNTNNQCFWAEQVFMDGNELTQVAQGTTPTTGQFSLDSQRHVVLADNPSGHQVEVTTRQYWVIPASNNVTIQNFIMKHAAVDTLRGAVSNYDASTNSTWSGWVIQNSNLSHAHGAVVSFQGSNYPTGNKLINNDISYGGDFCIHSAGNDGLEISGNKIHNCGLGLFNVGWGAGAWKGALEHNAVIDNNEVYGGNGPGLWCDITCDTVTISNNSIHDNGNDPTLTYNAAMPGILYEISINGKIFGNKIWNVAYGFPAWAWGGGILSSSSDKVEIYNNTVAWTPDGIIALRTNRSDAPPASTGLYVHDNNIIFTKLTTQPYQNIAMGWMDDGSYNITTPLDNKGSNNGFYLAEGEGSGDILYWGGSSYNTISSWNLTRGGGGNSYLFTSTQKDALLQSLCIPLNPGGVIPCSTPTPTATGETPYKNFTIPGIIEAEDYDNGGEGVAYHDVDSSNNGGQYRNDGVDIKTTADINGGYAVGWNQAGEWLNYTFSNPQSGSYDISARVGSIYTDRTISISIDGMTVGTISVPQMPAWDQYQTVTIPNVSISAGTHVMKVLVGSQDWLDFNWLKISNSQTTTPTTQPTNTPIPNNTPTPTIISKDTTSPTISISYPAANSAVNHNTTINIQAIASDNVGVTKVEFYVNGTLMCSDTTNQFTCAWKVLGAKNKSYTISAKAYDAAGNTSTTSLSVIAK